MKDLGYCPYCKAPLKSGWSSNELIRQKESDFINFIFESATEGFCEKCGPALLDEAKVRYSKTKQDIVEYIESNIHKIQIITIHTPPGWIFEPVSIITSQSVTGTGLFSEIASSFTDFLGRQSGAFSNKLIEGEKLCFSQLRFKALQLGANAILGTDIDYGEVGGGKGMLLVCAAGTAVKVKNTEVIEYAKDIEELMRKSEELNKLDEGFKKSFPDFF
jgi:uncharacterized protein YbjQ (UPF0145 family)